MRDTVYPGFKQPNLSEIRTRIEAIEALQAGEVDTDRLKEELRFLLGGFQNSCILYDAGMALFRGRCVNRKPHSVTEIHAPPPDLVSKYQRCNRIRRSMFYCSTAINVPLHEIGIEAGQHVVLSEWKTNTGLLVNQVGYTKEVFENLLATRPLPDLIPKPELNPKVVWDRIPEIDKALRENHPDPELTELVSSFLSRTFTRDVVTGEEYRYGVSIAISEIMLSIDDSVQVGSARGCGGLQYPTMKMSGNGDNLALTLTFANEHLDFVCAHFLKVNGINSDRTYMTYEGLDTAKSVGPGGELIWSGRCEFQLPRDLISGSTWRHQPVKGTSDGTMNSFFSQQL